FAMLSNHYSFAYGDPHNWVVLILMMFAGAAIRQFFVMRHGFKLGRNGNPLPYALVGVLVIAGVILWIQPKTTNSVAANAGAAGAASEVSFEQVQKIVAQRCFMCHGTTVQMKGIQFTSPALIKEHAQDMYQQVVVNRVMPMNNATGMTDQERDEFARWFKAGAKTQ
ncbi:MAG: urate hydroxylase PuuD, partial [Burkholderiales bacterium]|nr:urate hydroxylase PuuD [Burkholderiales bacterium]